ncbi:MAG: oxygenase MpaB family protein [Burkholderiales bacterium]
MAHAKPNIAKLKKRGDPEADALIAKIQERAGDPMVVFQLMGAVARWMPGDPFGDLDADLVAFLEQPCQRPDWAHQDLLRKAQANYKKDKNPTRVVLGVYSLPALYLDPDIALALIGTGQLSLHVRPRLEHTQNFVDAVMMPGALDQPASGGPAPGWLWIRRVRLTHAIRRALAKLAPRSAPGKTSFLGDLVRNDPLAVLHAKRRWNSHDDEPIDQVELAYVMLTFSWAVADGVSRLGPRYRMGRAAREAHIHTWAVIGHMLGIVDELLPGIEPRGADRHAKELFEMLRGRHLEKGDPLPNPGELPPIGVEEGRQLMAALMVVLVDVARENIPESFRWLVKAWRWLDNVLQDLPRVLLYKLAGTETARMLHVTPAPLLHWLVCRLIIIVIDLRSWNTQRQKAVPRAGADPSFE